MPAAQRRRGGEKEANACGLLVGAAAVVSTVQFTCTLFVVQYGWPEKSGEKRKEKVEKRTMRVDVALACLWCKPIRERWKPSFNSFENREGLVM